MILLKVFTFNKITVSYFNNCKDILIDSWGDKMQLIGHLLMYYESHLLDQEVFEAFVFKTHSEYLPDMHNLRVK